MRPEGQRGDKQESRRRPVAPHDVADRRERDRPPQERDGHHWNEECKDGRRVQDWVERQVRVAHHRIGSRHLVGPIERSTGEPRLGRVLIDGEVRSQRRELSRADIGEPVPGVQDEDEDCREEQKVITPKPIDGDVTKPERGAFARNSRHLACGGRSGCRRRGTVTVPKQDGPPSASRSGCHAADGAPIVLARHQDCQAISWNFDDRPHRTLERRQGGGTHQT